MDDINLIAKALVGLSGAGGGVVAVVMFYLMRQDRTERIATQTKLDGVMDKYIDLLSATVSSREQMASVLEKIASKIGA